MWSRIKALAIPISIKLTVLYAAILSCILVCTSLLTMIGLTYVFYTQANEDLALSAENVSNYFLAGKPLDKLDGKEPLLIPGIVLRIFDMNDQLLFDSSANNDKKNITLENEEDEHDLNPLQFLPSRKQPLHFVHMEHAYYFYLNQAITVNGQVYQLHMLKPLSEQGHFLKSLLKSLFVTNLLGLLAAIISGIFISRKILHPIRIITAAAEEIAVNNLSKRIVETGIKDELSNLAHTFNRMLNRIQCEFEQQQRFASDASHELRTPVTVIRGYADMLHRWAKDDPALLEEGIEAIKSEADNMENLIEKLLILAEADQGRKIIYKRLEPLEPLIAEIAQETSLIAPQHTIVLGKNDSISLLFDVMALKQMLRIFIENSIKYTPPGGTITISSQEKSSVMEITIQDTGIGIPAEDLDKIFHRFYRVDKSRSKETGGTGLGLSIAQWIANQHHSKIQVTSELHKGTTITITMPLSATDER